jgi:membrane protease YdiL (CAAX protease family)
MNSLIKIDDAKTTIILLYAPLALTIFRYFGWDNFYFNRISQLPGPGPQYYYFLSSLILLGIIPTLLAVFVLKIDLSEMGLGLGNVKTGAILTIIGLFFMVLLAYISSKNAEFRTEYPLYRDLLIDRRGLSAYLLVYGLYYLGWEIFFRGFMLFGLRNKFGDTASILIQTIPSCLMHIGKPQAEIFSSILAGLIFGWAALKCRSIWPIFIAHWGLGAFLDLFIIYG